jgi:hypothetical protein
MTVLNHLLSTNRTRFFHKFGKSKIYALKNYQIHKNVANLVTGIR